MQGRAKKPPLTHRVTSDKTVIVFGLSYLIKNMRIIKFYLTGVAVRIT